MAYEYEAPETFDTGGGNWLKEPGTYHLIVLDVDEQPSSRDGKALDAIRIQCQVLAGTTPGQEKKQFDLMLWHPKLTDKNEGLFARQKQGRFFIAASLIDESAAGKKVQINLQDARARQFICTTELDEKGRVQLHFADIWHIDDPDAAAFPKCAKSLKLIPAAQRRDAKSFEKKEAAAPAAAKSNGNGGAGGGGGTAAKSDKSAASTAAASGGVDLSDL